MHSVGQLYTGDWEACPCHMISRQTLYCASHFLRGSDASYMALIDYKIRFIQLCVAASHDFNRQYSATHQRASTRPRKDCSKLTTNLI